MIQRLKSRMKRGRLRRTSFRQPSYAEKLEKDEWLTAIYFVNAPALPRNDKRRRELKALATLQKWITYQRKRIKESVRSYSHE